MAIIRWGRCGGGKTSQEGHRQSEFHDSGRFVCLLDINLPAAKDDIVRNRGLLSAHYETHMFYIEDLLYQDINKTA